MFGSLRQVAMAAVVFGGLLGLAPFAEPAARAAEIVVHAQVAPAPLVETIPVAPRADLTWVPGHWVHHPLAGTWSWDPGHYADVVGSAVVVGPPVVVAPRPVVVERPVVVVRRPVVGLRFGV